MKRKRKAPPLLPSPPLPSPAPHRPSSSPLLLHPVEANDSLQRQFTPSCKASKVSFEIGCCLCLQPSPKSQRVLFVLRRIVVHSCLERCPCLSLKCAPVGGRRSRPSVAVVSGCRFRLHFERTKNSQFLLLRFSFFFVHLSSGFTVGDSVTFSVIQFSV